MHPQEQVPSFESVRIELIANPRSGKGAGPRLAEAVATALRQQGHEVATHIGLDGEDAARWAREKSATADRLAVLGGDGTLSAILPGLPEEPPPLAFLPLGTSNLVAHELGLPREPAGIARLIEDGEIQEIDLGSVNGRPSFLVWDFGAGGELMRRMEESRSGPIRKSQYLPIGWKMMREWRSPPQRVIADGEDLGDFEFGIVAGLPLYASWMLRLGAGRLRRRTLGAVPDPSIRPVGCAPPGPGRPVRPGPPSPWSASPPGQDRERPRRGSGTHPDRWGFRRNHPGRIRTGESEAPSPGAKEMNGKTIEIAPGVKAGPGELPLLIAGPCVVEGPQTLDYAEQIAEALSGLPCQWIFKASYDKANRTSVHAERGVGMQDGLELLSKAGSRLGVPVLTDVHAPGDCEAAAQVADILQIPAFLSRQTDLLQAAGKTGRTVNVKKGQFMAPGDVVHAARKVESTGGGAVMLTERGTFFGYGRLVVDFASLPDLQEGGYPVLLDGTHSVQRPGGLGDRTGGDWTRAPILLRAGAAAGFDGFFLETHPCPENSPSDGPNMIPLAELRQVLEPVLEIAAARSPVARPSV